MMTEFCSQIAQTDGDALAGSASHAEVWLLLEYRGAWREKAVTDNELPATTQHWLDSLTTNIANSRVVFIRRAAKPATLSCYIAITREDDQRLYHFALESYADLETVDVAAVIAGEWEVNRSDDKLVLVCTNGKRDRCCAKFGLPVYNALALENGLSVWQSTHLGGHRYAAVAAVFPMGIYYGYLNPLVASDLADHVRRDRIMLAAYRGRTFYSGVVNAGDYFLRMAGVRGSWVVSAEITPQNLHQLTFQTPTEHHTVIIESTLSEPAFVGCTANKYKPQPIYKLCEIGSADASSAFF